MIDYTIKGKLRFNDSLTFNDSHILYDYVEKLEQIEQIFKEWTECGDYADSWAYRKIREVLENE